MTFIAVKSLLSQRLSEKSCAFCQSRRFVRRNRSSAETGAINILAASIRKQFLPASVHRTPSATKLDNLGPDRKSDGKKWNLVGSMCLERPPVVSAERSSVEQSFFNLLSRQEFEQSLYSDHEVNKLQDVEKAKQKSDPEFVADEEVVIQTAQDREDAWNENLERFQPANRDTDEDSKSVERKLDQKLYLVVNQVLGKNAQWVLPKAAWQGSESLRETAERALRSSCGNDLQFTTVAGTPAGWYKYKYPEDSDLGKEFYGAKVFFFKALLQKGTVHPSKDVVDYKWVTRHELQSIVIPSYFDRIERFMFEFAAPEPCDNFDHESLMKLRY